MVSTKPGVVLVFSPAVMYMLERLIIWSSENKQSLVITAGVDGKHMGQSKHYKAEALDVRSKNFPDSSTKHRFVQEISGLLGPRFFVFLEAPGTMNEHFHMQVVKGGSYP